MAWLKKDLSTALIDSDYHQLTSFFLEDDDTYDPSVRRTDPPFLSYCRFLRNGQCGPLESPNDITYGMLDAVRRKLRLSRSAKPSAIRHALVEKATAAGVGLLSNDETAVIEFALRCSLMIDLRTYSGPSLFPKHEIEMEKWINSLFPKGPYSIDRKESRIPLDFTVAYMVRQCQLNIKWTSNLHDHLLLETSRGDGRTIKTLHIFTHVPALTTMLDLATSLIPPTVLAETLSTMQLLFPPRDDETQAYLSSVDALLREDLASIWYTSAIDLKETPDSALSQRPGADFAKIRSFAQLEHFRVRMLELKEIVFDDPPFTWGRFFSQLRNPEKFMNFWIAFVSVVILTLISTVAGVMQTVKAFHPTPS